MKNSMKRLFAVIFCLMFVAVSAVPPMQAKAATVATIKTTSGTGYANTDVNVRKDANINSKVVVVLNKKDAVKITGNKDGWLKVTVTHKGKTYKGYMGAKFVNLTNTLTFKKVMKSISEVNEGAAGCSLRAQAAVKKIKKYVGQKGAIGVSSYETLARKWLKDNAKKGLKTEIKHNIKLIEESLPEEDATDVAILQFINGVKAACKK